MLPYEEMVGDYVRETGNHVLYRVTPVFDGDDLVAKGVQMEAMSVEDKGEDIKFNVFVYNVQDGVKIDIFHQRYRILLYAIRLVLPYRSLRVFLLA